MIFQKSQPPQNRGGSHYGIPPSLKTLLQFHQTNTHFCLPILSTHPLLGDMWHVLTVWMKGGGLKTFLKVRLYGKGVVNLWEDDNLKEL